MPFFGFLHGLTDATGIVTHATESAYNECGWYGCENSVQRGTDWSKCGQPKAGKASPMGSHGGPVTCESGIVFPPEPLDLTCGFAAK